MNQKELLTVLELDQSASWEEVNSSFNRLLREWAPDRFHKCEKLRLQAESYTQKLINAFDELEQIHAKGSWGCLASSAWGFHHLPSNESDLKQVVPDVMIDIPNVEDAPWQEPQWSIEVCGLQIDTGVLTLSLGIATLLFIPIFIVLHSLDFSAIHEIITPLSETTTTFVRWGHGVAFGVAGGLIAYLATL
jgi:hypothetical protein